MMNLLAGRGERKRKRRTRTHLSYSTLEKRYSYLSPCTSGEKKGILVLGGGGEGRLTNFFHLKGNGGKEEEGGDNSSYQALREKEGSTLMKGTTVAYFGKTGKNLFSFIKNGSSHDIRKEIKKVTPRILLRRRPKGEFLLPKGKKMLFALPQGEEKVHERMDKIRQYTRRSTMGEEKEGGLFSF